MLLAIILFYGCNNNNNGNDELDIAVCAPQAGPFSLTIDNPFSPMPVGQRLILEGEEDGVPVRVEITVLDETEEVAGVTTRVVEERDFEDDELIEIFRNFLAQAPDGTVCYYGEDVDIFEDGQVISHQGQWRAGEGNNQAGILMPAEPAVGQVFAIEGAPGIAEDRAEIIAIGEAVTVPAGMFDNTLRLVERNPLDGDEGEKVFANGTGLIVDEAAELTEVAVVQVIPFAVAEIFFELNNTDGDLGIHGMIDGGPWTNIEIIAPDESSLMATTASGSLLQQAVTELFFESAEPPFDELEPEAFFARFPEGTYEVKGRSQDGDQLMSETEVTHIMPAPPVPTVNGAPMAEMCDEEDLAFDATEVPQGAAVTIAWPEVITSHPDLGTQPPTAVVIHNYEVVVEVKLEVNGEEFASVFSVILSPDERSMTIPAEFLALRDTFKYEVLVREEGFNQTAVESCFVIVE
jgi:hypothetical protein